MRLVSRFGFALVGCLAIGLSSQGTTASGQSFPRILVADETDSYEAVGIVGSQRRGGFCSGTLITDSHVLTAAHCAQVIEGPTSGTFELLGRIYETVDVVIHPEYNARTLANDIAILQLAQPVTEVLPSQIFRDEPLVGDVLLIVGYGGTGSADSGSDGTFGTKRVGVTTIDEVTSTLVSWTFDDANESNTASGDSGGPGYLDVDGDLFIACITSGGTEPDSSLGDFAFNTRVDAFADWIDATILASLDPGDEPVDEPTDDTPQDDDADGGCDSFLSCLFGDEDIRPFPILQLLIDALTTILDWLNEVDAELEAGAASDAETEQPGGEQPIAEEPGGEQPTEEQPADCPVTQEPVPADPITEDPGPEDPVTEDPVIEEPVVLDPVTGEPITIPPGSIPGELPGGVDEVGVELPAVDATELEIRRWMLEHPALRDLVKHRL